jgi:hypothetical protein
MKLGIIDRFEGKFAVVEIEGAMTNILRRRISAEAREGDVIVLADRKWAVNHEVTQLRRQAIETLVDELWE